MINRDALIKILILTANPKGSSPLRLDQETREISEGLRLSKHRDRFQLESRWAMRSRDLYRHLLETKPTIIHFSGHGTGDDGLILEDDSGQAKLFGTEQLTSLFKLFASRGIECVVLNACYSQVQSEAISQHIPYVIGMEQAIGDKAAITFSIAFYDALGAGESVEFAFQLACTQLIEFKEHLNPVLKSNPNLKSNHLRSTTIELQSHLPDKLSEKLADKIGVLVQGGNVSISTFNLD